MDQNTSNNEYVRYKQWQHMFDNDVKWVLEFDEDKVVPVVLRGMQMHPESYHIKLQQITAHHEA